MAVFHPIGFPGRPLRVMTNVTVVDDVWAMVGSSAFRRRGLTFDGGLDMVLFDSTIRDGRGVAIADLRRRLMAAHLDAAPPPPATAALFPVPSPTWVRLADAHSAFTVCKEMLDHGGNGLIEPLWTAMSQARRRSRHFRQSVADPDGRDFSTLAGGLLALMANLATLPPPP